ncbi:TPA: YgiQ family radical SAM protein [Clostridium perfringens]|uniref:YgiQ family radical SAM protein n=1 Tax=Clostridium perfringens TaxID=1502 RepID=UPI000F5368CE|nr:YgiQ family radical SAM protein [Clostridium perfringens]EGT0014291.1 YgiQ family radical SAM protein [Clostridium perfringens]EGT4144320.1 YgiQ family radical SAM protein [Clostridium perfringens]EIW6613586.1 YgiQ family radical SAM protein [Clostridium perfringens]EJT6170554.1 YgiQ family radical SAM protein [Clostridium perfringens]EJT6340349.1 YgiQ family radical SAM protein [Clostridium perfringens]
MSENKFLPICKDDMIERGWEQCDFVLVTADAYIDHHSFGTAIISRVLENAGYKVGIIAQPDWKSVDDFKKLGRPRLGFLVNGGNMDPMVNHYTVSKKLRKKDLYTPKGEMGKRPDRATIVYCNKIREAYKDVNIVIGGIEASLRRFAHYDYWDNKVRKSILVDSGADLLVYGMSEKQIVEVADFLNQGFDGKYIRHIPGTCYIADSLDEIYEEHIVLPSFKEVSSDKRTYAECFKIQYDEQDPVRGRTLVQEHNGKYVVINKPEMPLSREELDRVYALPYQKTYHPIYEKDGGIAAIEEVKFSLVSSRGCSGNCSFCAITFHQGRIVTSRSEDSIVEEAEEITKYDDFKGYIHDIGGPTANFRKPACKKQLTLGACKHKRCMSPGICKNMEVDHREYLHLLRRVRKLPGIKKVFIRSGLRYDYIMADKDDTFFKELVEHHVSGQLKVAPEHVSPNVLKYMGKPAGKTYDEFRRKFFRITERLGKKQFIIPYLMSSHPGCKLEDAIMLAEYLRDINYQPEQVQDFYPTPGTLSTTMFYTGLDPLTMEEVYIPRSKEEKAMQRALLQFKNPKNYNIVYDALVKAGREDLIGNGPKCLIRDKNSFGKGNNHSNHKSGGRKSRNENSGRRESEDKKRSSHSKKQRGNKSRGFEQKSQRGSKGKKRR